ncbi:hypothetical protein [Aliamphritea spongicola]|nr:hypothetical protein [Aliamphritea spongicola]
MGQINQQRLSGLYKFQDECLTLLTGVTDASHAVTYLLDDRAKPMCYKNHQMQPLMHREYLTDFYKSDPLYPANFKESHADVVKMNDLVQPYRRNTHPYYRDFVTPWGIQDIVELFFHVDGKLIAGAALFTSKGQPELMSGDLKRFSTCTALSNTLWNRTSPPRPKPALMTSATTTSSRPKNGWWYSWSFRACPINPLHRTCAAAWRRSKLTCNTSSAKWQLTAKRKWLTWYTARTASCRTGSHHRL